MYPLDMLVAVVIYVALIAFANRKKTLTRRQYFLRLALLLALLFLASVILWVAKDMLMQVLGPWVVLDTIPSYLAALFGIPLIYWSVQRAQDAGWSRWWTLLLFSPVSIIYLIFLLCWPSLELETPGADNKNASRLAKGS